MKEIQKVKITEEFITLGQLLKVLDLVSTGGEVKIFLNENKIFVNNEEDNRRGRKLRIKDKILINNKEYEIC